MIKSRLNLIKSRLTQKQKNIYFVVFVVVFSVGCFVTLSNLLDATNIINSTTNKFLNSIKNYKVGSFGNNYIVDARHKLLYCYIPKNACTKFKQLFYATSNEIKTSDYIPETPSGEALHLEMINIRYQQGRYWLAKKLIHDDSWKTMVVVRDPLERLVSGFMDKCIKDGRHWCEGDTLNETQFDVFAQRIITKFKNGQEINDHFRPQHSYCGLDIIYPKYVDYTIYYDKKTVGDETLKYLKDVGMDSYYYNWGKYRNMTLFELYTWHTLSEKKSHFDDCAFYQRFYTKQLLQDLEIFFEADYSLFSIKKPKWTKCIL